MSSPSLVAPDLNLTLTKCGELEKSTNTIENGTEEEFELDSAQQISSTNWSGFKVVGDNVDKNFHPSFQRYDNKTHSMHAFHIYVVQDHIDFSTYSDVNPTSGINANNLMINKADLEGFNDAAAILLSRYF